MRADNVYSGSFNSDEFRSTGDDTPRRSARRAGAVVRPHLRLLRPLSQSCASPSCHQHRKRVCLSLPRP